MSPLHIFCNIDEKYAPHLAVLVKSIAATNPGRTFTVHVLHDNVTQPTQGKIAACTKAADYHWHAVTNFENLNFKPFLQISRAAYIRLLAPRLLPQNLNTVLYLDVDIVVNGLLDELWATDLTNHACAAVVDPGINIQEFTAKNDLQSDGSSYFNSGVMLLNLKAIREEGLFEKALNLISAPNNFEYPDQDALNVALWQKWLPLDKKWNFQRKFLYDGASHAKLAIIHFSDQIKPWQKSEWHPAAWLYLRYLLCTPFWKDVLKREHIGPFILAKRFLKYYLRP